MAMDITIDQAHLDRVLTVLQQQGMPYPLEGVVGLCPDLTWDQVFLAIDCLSRSGQIRLTLDANRTYRVQLSRPVACVHMPLVPVIHEPSAVN